MSGKQTMRNVRLTHLDGKLPNLALMKLSHFYKAQGAEVVLSRNVQPDFWEPVYDKVYGSAVFTRSQPIVERFKAQWPEGIVGGSGLGGSDEWNTVERELGVDEYEHYDYSIYDGYEASIGFTMRGCRLACAFCVVPRKEGKPRSVNSVADIWRGEPWPKHLVILDNDFFGQPPRQYEARIQEILDGNFKVSFNQGINVRLLRKQEHADALAAMKCMDDGFTRRCIYTAFDNSEDEQVFRRGIEFLLNAGFRGQHILVYMLIGFAQDETWDKIFRRYDIMSEYKLLTYPMVYQQIGDSPSANVLDFHELKQFQRWVIRRYHQFIPFEEYKKGPPSRDLHEAAKALDLFGLEGEAEPRMASAGRSAGHPGEGGSNG